MSVIGWVVLVLSYGWVWVTEFMGGLLGWGWVCLLGWFGVVWFLGEFGVGFKLWVGGWGLIWIAVLVVVFGRFGVGWFVFGLEF